MSQMRVPAARSEQSRFIKWLQARWWEETSVTQKYAYRKD